MPPTPVSGDVQLVADAANSAGIEVPLSGRQEQEQELEVLFRSRKSSLATKNLLEVTDGLRRPP